MFIPMVAKKGGTVHRRAGWVFVSAMTIVSVTALILAGARFATDPTPQGRSVGAFLSYVAILTGAGVSAGIRVLRAKRRTAPHRSAWDLGLPALLLTSAGAIAVYGVITGQALFMAFSVIGLVNGTTQLAYWLRAPKHAMYWWCTWATCSDRASRQPRRSWSSMPGGLASSPSPSRCGSPRRVSARRPSPSGRRTTGAASASRARWQRGNGRLQGCDLLNECKKSPIVRFPRSCALQFASVAVSGRHPPPHQ